MTDADADGWNWLGRDLQLNLKVMPRARRTEWQAVRDGRLILRLKAPPVDGKANAALVDFLAAEFGVGRRQVRILSGEHARHKRILIQAPARLPALPSA